MDPCSDQEYNAIARACAHDYREQLTAIADGYGDACDTYAESLLAGYPEHINADTARRIAAWLRDGAEDAWGPNDVYERLADDIESMVDQCEGSRS